MKTYAVIDTNVIISALMTKRKNSPPVQIILAVAHKKIVPVIHEQILKEYIEVSHRMKFHFSENKIQKLLKDISQHAKFIEPLAYPFPLIDEKDRIFFEVCLSAKKHLQNVYLVTGNKKHFPQQDFIASPQEMIEIVKNR